MSPCWASQPPVASLPFGKNRKYTCISFHFFIRFYINSQLKSRNANSRHQCETCSWPLLTIFGNLPFIFGSVLPQPGECHWEYCDFSIYCNSFDTYKIRKPEFAKIDCGKLNLDHGDLVAEDRIWIANRQPETWYVFFFWRPTSSHLKLLAPTILQLLLQQAQFRC